jgi:hypothetical protein
MALEYAQRPAAETPNPLKVHNLFILAAAGTSGLAALLTLLDIRALLAGGTRVSPLPTLVLAFILLGSAGMYLYRCLSQLHVLFGRDWPRGLIDGQPLAEIKETLRHQRLDYPEPEGPIAGLLYTLARNLVYAPWPLRLFAEWQFRGALTMAILLLGLSVTLLVGAPVQAGRSGSTVLDWIGGFFLVWVVWTLIRPMAGDLSNRASRSVLSIGSIGGLAVFSVIGPVLILVWAPPLPPLPLLEPFPHVFVFILAALGVQGIFFAAVVSQTLPPPANAVSVIRDTWDLSCNPALVSEEFSRAMQDSWTEGRPNRVYARQGDPGINLKSGAGSFAAEILEETQPIPCHVGPGDEAARPMFPSGARPLVLALDAVGLLMAAGMAFAGYRVGQDFLTGRIVPATAILYFVSCGALAAYAFGAAQRLWLRFDFRSRLVWMEMSGNYLSARVDQGSALHGALRASSSMVQVEGMTFRLWVAVLHTVSFGKDAPRQLVSLAGEPDFAGDLFQRLKGFGLSQAAIPHLANTRNAERFNANMAMSNLEIPSLPGGTDPARRLGAGPRPSAETAIVRAAGGAGGYILRGTTGAGAAVEVILDADRLASGGVILGRAPECGVVIPSPQVSRRHARLFTKSEKMYVEDLNSSNGTFVSGQRLAPSQAAPVRHGDTVTVADTRFALWPA